MLFVVFLGYFGMTMPYVVIPKYIVSDFIHYPSGFFDAGLLLGLYPFGLFLGSILIGSLSDKYGRKNLLLITLAGAGCCYLLTGLSITYHNTDMFMLFRLLSGVFEGNISIARAVIAELSKTKMQVYKGFSWINSMLTLSWIIGPYTGAFIFQATLHQIAPVFFISGFIEVIAIFVVFNIKIDNKSNLNFLPVPSNKNIIHTRIFLFLFIFVAGLAVDGMYQFLPLYTTLYDHEAPFKLAEILSLIAFSNMISNLFINEFFLKRMGVFLTFSLGFICFVTAVTLIAIKHNVSSGCALLLGASIALIITNAQALISLNAAKHSQGKFMGLMSSFRMLGCGIMSFSQANLAKLSYTLPFIVAIALITVASIILGYIKCVFGYVLDE